MSFSERYRAVFSLTKTGARSKAVELYIDLLKDHKEQVTAIMGEQENARNVHLVLARQYALRKILIQRVRGHKSITLDLALFSTDIPFQLTYDADLLTFLQSWKNGSGTFLGHKKKAAAYCDEVRANTANGVGIPDFSDADVYVAFWVIPDFLRLESYLPQRPIGYVNIGCGAGMLDCVYLRSIDDGVPAVLVDIDEEAAKAVESLTHCNGLTNTSFATSWQENMPLPSFVLSIRSCGFIYSVDTYDRLFKALNLESTIILDVRSDRISETKKYFAALGFEAEQVPIGGEHKSTFYKFSL